MLTPVRRAGVWFLWLNPRRATCSTANFADRVTNEVRELFEQSGGSLYDPQVTQMEHALQSAALAEREGANDTVVVASLLHDVGHLLLDEHSGQADFLAQDHNHETVGSDWLKRRFDPPLAEAVRLHVAAKRYLCATEPRYWEALSPASKRSLELQGGVFSQEEAKVWAQQPHAQEAVNIRRWDDMAKVASASTPPLEHFLSKINALVSNAQAES